MNEPTALLYYESQVAELLGISRADLTYLRKEHLKKKEGWDLHGRDVVLTEAGLSTLLLKIKATLHAGTATDLSAFLPACVNPPAPIAEKKEDGVSPPPPARELVELTVQRCYPNYRLLQATTPLGQVVDVRVRNNKNFIPKMTLNARQNSAGKWEMEGRCPRSRGRY